MLDYDKLLEALLTEAQMHRDALPSGDCPTVWTARMTAAHVLVSIAMALSKARQ